MVSRSSSERCWALTKDVSREQAAICSKYGLAPVAAASDLKVGVARNLREGIRPVNGLRHSPTADTTGWYLWAGEELSDDPDFFVPLHVRHLEEWCPAVIPFLALPPGWRFLVADGYEDVWEDPSLLETTG